MESALTKMLPHELIIPEITAPSEPIEYDPQIMAHTATTIVESLGIEPESVVLLYYQAQGEALTAEIRKKIIECGATFIDVPFSYAHVGDLIRSGKGRTQEHIDADMVKIKDGFTHAVNINANRNDDNGLKKPEELEALGEYIKARGPFFGAIMDSRWMKVDLPTPEEAATAGRAWDEYYTMVMRSFDRPWDQISEAQEILAQRLQQGSRLDVFVKSEDARFTTKLSMKIGGKSTANSTIESNFPGSEVFFGPERGTMNGTLGIDHPFILEGQVIPNLVLTIQDGAVTDYKVYDDDDGNIDVGAQSRITKLFDLLRDDETGKIEIGEFGIGTNSELFGIIPNPQLSEKARGLHLGIGGFGNDFSDQDNGVRTPRGHIDFVRQNGGTHSTMTVDGKVIQANGYFVDPRLSILHTRQG